MNTITREKPRQYFIKDNTQFFFDTGQVQRGYMARKTFERNSFRDKKQQKSIILERYFNDVYKLFLAKLNALAMGEKLSPEGHSKMKTMLDEIIKVRGLLEKEEVGESEIK